MLNQFWDHLNSPFSLIIFGFIFTTVAGTIITARYQRATYKQETRFSQLHKDRAEAIRSLYELIIDVDEALFNLLYKWRPVGLYPPAIEPEDVANIIREFHRQYEKSTIYFTQDTCSLFESMHEKYNSTWGSMEQVIMMTSDPEEQPPQFDETAWDGVHIHSRNIRKKLQEEFRDIFGVEEVI